MRTGPTAPGDAAAAIPVSEAGRSPAGDDAPTGRGAALEGARRDAAPSDAGHGDARGGAAAGAGTPATRFATRERLFLAFAALAAAFAVAFAFQLAGLARIKDVLAHLHGHEEDMRLTIELESALRSQFAHQAHFIVGEDAHLAGYRDARARAADLARELSLHIDEPEAAARIEDIEATGHELDRIFEEEIAPAVLQRTAGAMLAHDKTYRLVFRIEENVDALFAFLRTHVVKESRRVDDVQRATARLGIVFVVATMLFAVALAVYLSRSISRPLAVLGAGAARIAGGDLETRIDVRAPDEFGRLASEFNEMAAALKRHQERLVRSEKLATLGSLAAGIAHELNNPLQVMLGYLSVDRGRVKGEVASHLRCVEREATRCKEIVEGLLQLSRPAVAFVPVHVDLREVSEEVADAIRMSMHDGAPAVVIEGAGTALGTRCRFRQIIFNLAKNAAEAAGAAGEVRIKVSSAGPAVEVAVSDTGPGVPPELRHRVFEPFFTTKSHGVGLGLAISRAIAGALGGDLDVDRSEAGGARFTLRVPRPVEDTHTLHVVASDGGR